MKYLLFLMLIVIGCGKQTDHRADRYLEKFKEEAKARGIDVDVNIVTTVDNNLKKVAWCNYDIFGNSIVLGPKLNLDEEEYNLITEITIFHELGHCILGRTHLHEDEDGIMSPIGKVLNYSLNRQEYLDELFAVND